METRTRTTRSTEIAAGFLVAFAVALVAFMAPGCGGGGSPRASAESGCVALLEFQDREYVGSAMRGAAPDIAEAVGTALAPGCNDVRTDTSTTSTSPASTKVEAYKLVGIPAERALGRKDEPDIVYVARGICRDESTPSGLVACLRRDA